MRESSVGKAGVSAGLFTGAGGLEGWSSCSRYGSQGLHPAVCTSRVWFSLWLLRMHTELMGPWRRLCPAEAGAALFLALPGCPPPTPRRPVSTSGKHPVKYQIPGDELPLEVSIWKKMSVLCQVTSYHFCCWAFTDVLPTSFIFCGSASPCSGMEEQESLPFAT